MLIPSHWRFVAEGNAHLVYRYIGPLSDCFSGMVLKLPRQSPDDDERLWLQHKFVRSIVTGDPFSRRGNHGRVSSSSMTTDGSDGATESDLDSVSDSDGGDPYFQPSSLESALVMRLPSNGASAGTAGMALSSDPCELCAPLDPNSRKTWVPGRRRPPDRGLVSPVHVPSQHLHLFLNKQTGQLRDQVRNLRRPSTAEGVPNGGHHIPRTDAPTDALGAAVPRSPYEPTAAGISTDANACLPECSVPSLSFVCSHDPGGTPLASQSSSLVPEAASGLVVPADNVDDEHLPYLTASKSSFALVEKDLISPPVEPSRLLSVDAHLRLVSASKAVNPPAWVYLACEMKPKSGLPAVIGSTLEPATAAMAVLPTAIKSENSNHQQNRPSHDLLVTGRDVHDLPQDSGSSLRNTDTENDWHVSRFTMQQRLKLKKNAVESLSLYKPETFFSRLSDLKVLTSGLHALLQRPQNNWRLFVDGARMETAVSDVSDSVPSCRSASMKFLKDDGLIRGSGAASSSESPFVGQTLERDCAVEFPREVATSTIAAGPASSARIEPSLIEQPYPMDDGSCKSSSSFHLHSAGAAAPAVDAPISSPLSGRTPLVKFRVHASDIFPFWMSWSGALSPVSTDPSPSDEPTSIRVVDHATGCTQFLPQDFVASVRTPVFAYLPLPAAQLVMARFGRSSLVRSGAGSARTDAQVTKVCGASSLEPSKSGTCGSETRKSADKSACSSLRSRRPSSIARLFHQQFPIEVLTDPSDKAIIASLQAMTDLMGAVISVQSNLFHRLSYMHALCEGQQYIANALLELLVGCGWLSAGEDARGTPPASIIDAKLMSDTHGPKSLQEFLIAMEADIARDRDWAFPRNTPNEYDAEYLFALRIQSWHWRNGRALWEQGSRLYQDTGSIPEAQINAICHWIYRYLIGRTFLDCSVMINVALSIDGFVLDGELDALVEDRFVKLATINVDDISSNDALDYKACQFESDGPTNRGSNSFSADDAVKVHLCTALRHLKVPVVGQFVNQFASDDAQGTSTGHGSAQHSWTALQRLLMDASSKKPEVDAESRASTISIWYRLSVVDLDLKRASKIPQWATQLDDILAAHREHSDKDVACQFQSV